ncbi:MAG: O-antigen ligase family protein, partial [Deltaproteobacteria bacterium]
SPPIIVGVLGTLIWFFSGMFFRLKSLFKQSWLWPALAFIALAWVGLLYTPDPYGFGVNYAGKTYYWLFCVALASLSLETLRPRILINAFLLGLAVNACVGMLQFAGFIAPKQGWFSGLTRGYNTLTVYLVLGILMCSFYFGEAKEWRKRWVLILLMALYFFHLIILEGRTGYLTFILLSPLVLKTLFRKLNGWKVLLVWVLIMGAMSLSPIVRERVHLTVSELKYHMNAEKAKAWGREFTTHQDRFYYWYGAVRIFLENPILGVGTGGYPMVLKGKGNPDDPIVSHPHNNVLYMAASYGVFGIVVFTWFFWEMLRNSLKERDTVLGYFILCTALVLLVNGLFNTTVLDAGTVLLWSLAVGLQSALPKFVRARPSAVPNRG